MENYIFRPKNFGGERPQNQMQTFYVPKGTHQVGKFDISQSTPYFWPIFEFQALKNCVGQPLPTLKFLEGNAPEI